MPSRNLLHARDVKITSFRTTHRAPSLQNVTRQVKERGVGTTETELYRDGFIDPPDDMTCGITQQLALDPVVASDGRMYSWSALAQWVSNHTKSPFTNKTLEPMVFVPLYLRDRIQEWIDVHCPQERLAPLPSGGETMIPITSHPGFKPAKVEILFNKVAGSFTINAENLKLIHMNNNVDNANTQRVILEAKKTQDH